MEEVKREEIINKLQDDSLYYGSYGKQFLSNSNIGTLINNPGAFLEPTSDSINLMFGRAFHELVMFGETQHDNFIEASTRNTKIYKEAASEAGEMIFLKKEWDDLNSLVDKAFKNKEFKSLVKKKSNKFEVPNIGTLDNEDITWKCKADIVTDDEIIDIKTSSNIHGFKYSSKTWNYDSQAFIYSTMFQKPMKFLVVDKNTGCVGIFETTDEAYMYGREKVLKAEKNYLDYFVNKDKKIENFTIYGEI